MEKEKLIALVQRAQRGDADALSELFAAYRNEVYSIAMQHTKNRALSEDIVQETFLEVILKIDTLNQPASFPSWLKVLAYHQCTRYYKKKERVHEVSAAENEDGFSVLNTLEETNEEYLPDAAVDQAEFRATILGMVDALPDAQRAALQMFYYEQMPLKVIAKVQGVSVNTANTRLNRGRLAVKNSVEEYEKKHGVRLHTIAFFPFFRWLLRGTKQAMPEDAAARVAQGIAVKSGVNLSAKTGLAGSAAAPAVPTVSAAAKTAAAGLKVIPAGLATKIVAGVAAVSVVAGGVAVVQSGVEQTKSPEIQTVMQEVGETNAQMIADTGEAGNINAISESDEDIVQKAYRAYRNYLTIGRAHRGYNITHYAFLDIDQDGIPELIAANADGTHNSITTCELITFRNGSFEFCGEIEIFFDTLYYVNNQFLRGCSELGAEYISPTESIRTSSCFKSYSSDRYDPAISYNERSWEYITQEEFDYYNVRVGGFVTDSDIVVLQKNDYRNAVSDQFFDPSKGWTTTRTMNGRNYAATWVFDSDGVYYYLIGEVLSEYYVFYSGTYNLMDDILVLSKEKDNDLICCAFQWDGASHLTQISEEGFFPYNRIGATFELKEDEWHAGEVLKGWVQSSVEEEIGTLSILSDHGQYRLCPYFNKETGQTGFVGVDIFQGEHGTLIYFGCWVDGVSASAEDFMIEYQEGITQYTVQGNRNRDAQYTLTIHQQDAYVDVTVKRIADEYQVVPEGDYRFYLAD